MFSGQFMQAGTAKDMLALISISKEINQPLDYNITNKFFIVKRLIIIQNSKAMYIELTMSLVLLQ